MDINAGCQNGDTKITPTLLINTYREERLFMSVMKQASKLRECGGNTFDVTIINNIYIYIYIFIYIYIYIYIIHQHCNTCITSKVRGIPSKRIIGSHKNILIQTSKVNMVL